MSIDDIDNIKGHIETILEEEHPEVGYPDPEYERIAELIDRAVDRMKAAYDGG